jgi:hypothetical protein
VFTPELVEAADRRGVQPVVAAQAAQGLPYSGVV